MAATRRDGKMSSQTCLKEKPRHRCVHQVNFSEYNSLATLAPCPRSSPLLPGQSGSHTLLLRTHPSDFFNLHFSHLMRVSPLSLPLFCTLSPPPSSHVQHESRLPILFLPVAVSSSLPLDIDLASLHPCCFVSVPPLSHPPPSFHSTPTHIAKMSDDTF